MATRLFSSLRLTNLFVPNNILKLKSYAGAITILQENTRQLYAKASLGLEGFLKQKQDVQLQMANISEKFKEKIHEYCEDINKNMIFSEDLKNMIHLATTDEDVEVVVKMIKKYNKQNKQLRFGNFLFGPVVMRLFYTQNASDLALECFKAPELNGFFDQLITYQLLLDMLYENQRYQDILDIMGEIKNRQIEALKYPKNCVVLVMAACYKMNTKQSLEYALKLWNELLQIGHLPMRRSTTFCAALALNQGEPGTALEVLTQCRNQNYTTVRNIRLIALAETGRTEYIVPLLKSVLPQDAPIEQKQTFNKDVIERVHTSLKKLGNIAVISEINELIENLQKQGIIINTTLDQQLCMEIQRPPLMNNRDVGQGRNNFNRRPNYQNRQEVGTFNKRPGLYELV